MGGKINSSINRGNAPYVFRHSGQNYHCMGSLLPIDGSKPNFSQLYIYDTENEVSNRQHAFSTQKKGGKSTSHSLDIEIISFLKEEGNKMEEHITYLATASEIVALIVGDIGDTINNRDSIQKVLRCESYANLRSVQSHANNDISNFEKLVILPSSFMVGAHYMMQTYLDAMSFCKWFGYPYFFIIVTCNPKWPEIKRFLADTTLNPEDRPDILYRLFKIQLDSLIKDLKKKRLLGLIQAVVYTVEFQKHGPDRATVEVVQNNNGDDNDDAPVDEIKNYYYCRYLSVCEASWRIFGFDVHYKYPFVVRLPFHLPGKQNVVYQANDDIEDVINKQFVSSSMFLS
ncbi:hypothetical protein Lser_V15G34043 [Lactuca serriola]